MARVAWPAAFPLGVADAGATLALCKAMDDLIVLRLADGETLWRERIDARPLLIGRGIAVAWEASEILAISLEESDRGALRWRVPVPVTPTETEAAWIGDEIGVHWQARERYRGGAHPGAHAPRGTQSGQCCIHPDSGAARPLAQWPEREEPAQWEASDDPAVLAACVLGSARYRLSSAPGSGLDELRLTAIHVPDNNVIWTRQIGALARSPAARLRP